MRRDTLGVRTKDWLGVLSLERCGLRPAILFGEWRVSEGGEGEIIFSNLFKIEKVIEVLKEH